jgi:NADP-dependent 3-hydroxy acid dehydrogenase YdfG
MQNLQGKTAFVTGSASGIGLGIAKALLGAGMNVVVADIRDDHLAEAKEELGSPDKILAIKLDVTNRADFAKAADAAEARFGKIHILCNNAGVAVVGPTELATFADWDWVMNVNVGGAINGVTTLLPRILSHGEGGHIINTCSMSGIVPVGGTTIYSTGKAALVTMMECIADAGETRPEELSETGYAEADKRRREGGNLFHLYQTKEEVGERVLRGILDDELYILTHSEFLAGVTDRANAMIASVPANLPENEEYKKTFAMLFNSPIWADEIARQKELKA